MERACLLVLACVSACAVAGVFAASLNQDTAEPRPDCPAYEEYRFCEPCNKTCDNPSPLCPAECMRGCFCNGDLVRDKDGNCVQYQNCSKFTNNETSNFVKPLPQLNCPPGTVYKHCQPCQKTCANPNPVCVPQCQKRCFCEDGLVKSPSGPCVKVEDCPKVTSLRIETCSSFELSWVTEFLVWSSLS